MTNDENTLRFGPVSSAGSGPLYAQLIDNIKREIASARLAAEEFLPSSRVLAKDLGVSVITVVRAYEELEKEGIVHSRQGRGTFISQAAREKLQVEQSAPWHHLLAAIDAAHKANMTDDELVALLRAALTQRGMK